MNPIKNIAILLALVSFFPMAATARMTTKLSGEKVQGGAPLTLIVEYSKAGHIAPIVIEVDEMGRTRKKHKRIAKIVLMTPGGPNVKKFVFQILTQKVPANSTATIMVHAWGIKKKISFMVLAAKQTAHTRPKKRALLVLLENGGIAQNLREILPKGKLPKIPVAVCGKHYFVLRPGENPAQMVNRLRFYLAANKHCLNPLNWRIRQMTPEEWVDKTSDYIIEETVKAIHVAQKAKSKYHKVVVLEDKDFKADKVLAEIRRLAKSYVLDIHILAHGGSETIAGYKPHRLDHYNFFVELKKIKPLCLRSVYQMNCKGGTLKDNWLNVGAEVVNGTKGDFNNCMPHQYFHFMHHWLAGESFGKSTSLAYKEACSYTVPLLILINRMDVQVKSHLTTQGKASITIVSR